MMSAEQSRAGDPLAEIAARPREDSLRHATGGGGHKGTRMWWLVLSLLALSVTGGLVWHFHDQPRYREGIRYDPIEDDPDAQPALRAAEQESEARLKDVPRRLGFCHAYWGTKKAVLKEKYGIEWHTPAELNPTIAFD